MKILYDIPVLGLAHYHERARTGIYRVVENIALGLSVSPECDVRFFSSWGNKQECLDYLKAHPILAVYHDTFADDISTAFAGFQQKTNLLGRLRALFHSNSTSSLPDIYHSPLFPIPEFVWSEPRISKVFTVHDLIPILFPQFFEFGEDRTMLTALGRLTSDTFIACTSESTKRDLCQQAQQIDPDKVFVTHWAASNDFYPCTDANCLRATRRRYGIPEDCHYFLSVCTLEPRKNVEMTIRCFVRLVLEQGMDNLCLVLTGAHGWSYDKILTEIADAEEVQDRIIVTGYVPDCDLAPLYSGAMLFVYPSLYEGFGLPPLEAMQCGTPVIVSNTSSLPEIVGDAGVFISPADDDGLCQAMLDLYGNDELRAELSKKSRLRASNFNWQKSIDETVQIYKKALKG